MTRSCMPGFFEAINNLPPPREKKHHVVIQGQQVEVSLQRKLEIIRHGEENFMISDDEIVLKPRPSPKTVYPILKTADKGYYFEQGDIHWPNDFRGGGKAWLIESE